MPRFTSPLSWHDATLNNFSLGCVYCREDIGEWLGIPIVRGVGFATRPVIILRFAPEETTLDVQQARLRFPYVMRDKFSNPVAYTKKKNHPQSITLVRWNQWSQNLPIEKIRLIDKVEFSPSTRDYSSPFVVLSARKK